MLKHITENLYRYREIRTTGWRAVKYNRKEHSIENGENRNKAKEKD